MCSTEANLEVVEVLMFLAGSYSEIWGCLFYSVNILKVTRQILSSLGHRGSEKLKKKKFSDYRLPVITGYHFFMGYPYL